MRKANDRVLVMSMQIRNRAGGQMLKLIWNQVLNQVRVPVQILVQQTRDRVKNQIVVLTFGQIGDDSE